MAPASTPRWSRPCRSWTPRTRSKGAFFGEHFGDSAVEDETGSSNEDSMDQWGRDRDPCFHVHGPVLTGGLQGVDEHR